MAKEGQATGSRPVILIIGESVMMDGIAYSLQEENLDNLVRWDELDSGFNAVRLPPSTNLIIFELEKPGIYRLFDLLREQPGIRLLGLHSSCEQVLVFGSCKKPSRTMAELYRIVREVMKPENSIQKEGIIEQ